MSSKPKVNIDSILKELSNVSRINLIVTSGVKKLYDDKYRELMFEYGTSKHPHPEERL